MTDDKKEAPCWESKSCL